MGITLHKSGTHPDARGDLGESFFKYAIYPHANGLGMDTVRRGYGFNYTPVLTDEKSLCVPFDFEGAESIVLETVKYGEDDGIVLRFYEALGASGAIAFNTEGREITECNVLEDELQCLGKGSVSISFKPFEIKTIKIK